MDNFENLIKTLLEAKGYWVRQSYKVGLSKAEKAKIGKPSMPRPEIDLLVLDFKKNTIIALEAKSYLDSPGVDCNELTKPCSIAKGKYKLFTCLKYRTVILRRLKQELISKGMAKKGTKVKLGLSAGKVQRQESEKIAKYFAKKGWFYWGPERIKKNLEELTDAGYENDQVYIVTKILNR
jgi:hypothetical protein